MNIYEALPSLKAPILPQRSRLFCLEPVGVGTAYTESLSSYLNRLAQEHCLTSQKLIMGEISPLILKNEERSELVKKSVSHLLGNTDAKPAINGMREKTKQLVTVLEQLTMRQDLRFLTLLSWKGIISERGLFRNYRSWCPDCLQQWEQDKKIIYEPLLWSFKDVEICLNHGCLLINECPDCNSSLPVIARVSYPGFCSHCHAWLGKNSGEKVELNENKIEEHRIIIEGIGEFIALTSKLKYEPIPIELTRKLELILFVFKQAIEQDLKLIMTLGEYIEKLKIATGKNQKLPYNLVKLVIPVCARARISLSELFERNFQELSDILFKNFQLNMRL